MDFSGNDTSRNFLRHASLPQFSELRPVSTAASTVDAAAASAVASTSTSEYTDGGNMQSQAVQTSDQANAASSSQKETSTNIPSKYFAAPLPGWKDTLMQLCEKQFLNDVINVPNYNQNNGILSVQSNNLSFINSLYLPSISQADIIKQELDGQFKEERSSDKIKQHQTAVAMVEYLQKLSADAPVRKVLKLCSTEQVQKEKTQEEKVEHMQNNILNIPNVRNIYLQNNNSFANSDQITVAVNPNDLNLQNEQEIENSLPNVLKVEQQVQTDLPKLEKKSKFRAKIGEIKINYNFDGTVLYFCPECNLGLPDKVDIEQHVQAHLQERKYQCKECGAMLKRKEHLDQHMRGHSDERPFKCQVCQKAFKRNEHLTRHCVIHSGNKDFPCTMCQKAFSRKDHLNKHLQTHLGVRKKMKDDSCYIDQKDTRVFDNSTDIAATPKQEVGYILKDGGLLKQEASLLQHIQNLHKNPTLLHTFASLKEQVMKDASEQTQSDNINENRYIMPS